MNDLLERAARVAKLLKTRGETVAVSESSAGGLISAALVAQPSASAYFRGGAVVYTKQARFALLGIDDAGMRGTRSASAEYAALAAAAVRERHGSTWGVAETGASGPSGNSYGDAAGHACLAIAGPRSRGVTLATGSTDRQANMRAFAAALLDLFADALEE